MASKPNVGAAVQDKTVEKHEIPSNQDLEIMYVSNVHFQIQILIITYF